MITAAMIELDDASDLWGCLEAFRPREQIGFLEWARQYVKSNEQRPFDERAFPHVGAPGGPADALDDPAIREVWMQWASRLGKTFTAQVYQQYVADVMPCPQMFASSSQKVALEVIARSYAMIEQNGRLVGLLPPPHRRKQDRIDLRDCEINVAWARSKDTLADKNVKVGHANELDKWEHQSTSTEADPLKLFMDRGKIFAATRKFILESTPAVKNRSRIEDGLLRSTNCRMHVPCPECGHYQQLRMGKVCYDLRKMPCATARGGLTWKPNRSSRHDIFSARETAKYECEQCGALLEDHHRAWMMRHGVWIPHGCEVNHAAALAAVDDRAAWRGWRNAAWIVGTPTRDGQAAGYQLSSLYALSLGWGDVAAEFVDSYEKPQMLRNFINQWLGETWELISRGQTWEQLGERMMVDIPHGIVPAGHSLITVGIDRQQDHYVYQVRSWGDGRRSHIVDYGERDTEEEIWRDVLKYKYPCQDGGTLSPVFGLIDSGYRAPVIYEFCKACQKRGFRLMPCKGSATSLTTVYNVRELGKDTSAPGLHLVHVDTISTQEWADRQFHDLRAGEPGSVTLYRASLDEHQSLLEQLLNEAVVTDLDNNNYEREKWQRPDTNIPNDFRDTHRYANVAMLLATKGRPIKTRQPEAEQPKSEPKPEAKSRPASPIPQRPHGWLSRQW